MIKKISLPVEKSLVCDLQVGDQLYLSGTVYTARDAAHRRMVEDLEQGKTLPFPLEGQAIYYVGPCPPPPGKVIGSAGPTTSGRMDVYTPRLLKQGLKVMIGKGLRSKEVIQAMQEYQAVYLATIGGAGALISRCIQAAEIIAYPELGPEAIWRLEVKHFPAVVVIDTQGKDLYKLGKRNYQCINLTP